MMETMTATNCADIRPSSRKPHALAPAERNRPQEGGANINELEDGAGAGSFRGRRMIT